MDTYEVTVETTIAIKNTTYGKSLKKVGEENSYRKCIDGFLYVITDNPARIYDEFPETTSIRKIGIGYVI